MIGLVLLAAGGSTRLAKPKQLLSLRGRSLLRHAAETALGSVCWPVVVVLGAKAEQIGMELAGLEVTIAKNPNWESGMGSSIRAGMEAIVAAGSEAVILMLCDQPLVSAGLLNLLAETWRKQSAGIVAAEYGGTVGVPALFSSSYFSELMALEAAAGAKGLLMRNAEKVTRVPFPEAALDIDTEEDYRRLQNLKL